MSYRWSRKWSCRRNALPQMSHENGLSSVWVRSCISRLYDLVNWRWQKRQMNFFLLRLVQHFFASQSTVCSMDWWLLHSGCFASHKGNILCSLIDRQHSSSSGSVADLAKLAKSKRFFFGFKFWQATFENFGTENDWQCGDGGGGLATLSTELAPGVCGGVRSRPGLGCDSFVVANWLHCFFWI